MAVNRRVVVTGLGVESSIGTDPIRFWENCLDGKSPVSPIPEHWRRYADYHSSIWATLEPLDPERLGITRVEAAQNDPASLIAGYSARQALTSAGLELELVNKRSNSYQLAGVDAHRVGVFMGTGIGGANSFLDNYTVQVLSAQKAKLGEIVSQFPEDGQARDAVGSILESLHHGRRFNPFVVSMLMPNAIPAHIGLKYSIKGPNLSYSIACASGTVAVGHAFHAVRDGTVDFAISGGSEYLDDYYGGIFHGFDIAKALVRSCEDPNRANRPFDVNRSGFLFSQGGAAVLLLEDLDTALGRGAPILAEIVGYAESFDAYSVMSIAPDGAQIERMMRAALADAGMSNAEIHYINAHGTGTQANDIVETEVIGRVFGRDVLVNSTKSLIGHTIGASGAIEALVTVMSLKDQKVHLCKNLEEPLTDLNFPREATSAPMDAALTQSFAFGGHNAGLVVKRFDG
jgi:3-oxoacyl-[acyl-carrier-protein] synthase II